MEEIYKLLDELEQSVKNDMESDKALDLISKIRYKIYSL
jgi:hypothetical protein